MRGTARLSTVLLFLTSDACHTCRRPRSPCATGLQQFEETRWTWWTWWPWQQFCSNLHQRFRAIPSPFAHPTVKLPRLQGSVRRETRATSAQWAKTVMGRANTWEKLAIGGLIRPCTPILSDRESSHPGPVSSRVPLAPSE